MSGVRPEGDSEQRTEGGGRRTDNSSGFGETDLPGLNGVFFEGFGGGNREWGESGEWGGWTETTSCEVGLRPLGAPVT